MGVEKRMENFTNFALVHHFHSTHGH